LGAQRTPDVGAVSVRYRTPIVRGHCAAPRKGKTMFGDLFATLLSSILPLLLNLLLGVL